MTDFTVEAEVIKNLRIVMATQEAVKDTAMGGIQKLMIDEHEKAMKRAVDGIYEKLELLQSAHWDVKPFLTEHAEIAAGVAKVLENFRIQSAETDNPEEVIDDAVENWRELMHLLLDIGRLDLQVNSLCMNFIKTIEKIT